MHFLAEIPIIKFAAAGLRDRMRFYPCFQPQDGKKV
ncbi:hypothetical protein CLOBOL_06420 [Enterocloster bolteae ATCC BAA-613]|uniref:Uncharacterized protein n=1 Tax=Enterocloster bolteae (strain ATCC BAA-613 / DSM 15670 / CCUG 46953 / JCM 12243 / WAL 16351) TaxID=411902 RepID=A8S2V6_ENTBW|nr:hypothetical protein CLOBOL_06420 [Enterocloster bolteae ATCC BAA-613]